jgi:hypothetical protein
MAATNRIRRIAWRRVEGSAAASSIRCLSQIDTLVPKGVLGRREPFRLDQAVAVHDGPFEECREKPWCAARPPREFGFSGWANTQAKGVAVDGGA